MVRLHSIFFKRKLRLSFTSFWNNFVKKSKNKKMAFGWSEGKSKKNSKIRRKINFVTQGVLTIQKLRYARFRKIEMKILILCFQTKKNLIEKTQKHKNGDSLKSGQNRQKSSKIDHFTVGGPCVRKMRFLPIFSPISKGRRFFVSRPFLSFFLFDSTE